MALQTCFKCGKNYSDSVQACPHCGFVPESVLCPECDSVCGIGDESCMVCGFALKDAHPAVAAPERVKAAYDEAVGAMEQAQTQADWTLLAKKFHACGNHEDAAEKSSACMEQALRLENQAKIRSAYGEAEKLAAAAESLEELEAVRKLYAFCGEYEDAPEKTERYGTEVSKLLYTQAKQEMGEAATAEQWMAVMNKFERAGRYEDAEELAAACAKNVHDIRTKKKRRVVGAVVALVLVAALALASYFFIIPAVQYNGAQSLFEAGSYEEAAAKFEAAGDFKDAEEMVHYAEGEAAFQTGDYVAAAEAFAAVDFYEDSAERIFQCGEKLLEACEFADASDVFDLAEEDDYKTYADGMAALTTGDYEDAIELLSNAGGVEDAAAYAMEANYFMGMEYLDDGNYEMAKPYFAAAGSFHDAADMIHACDLLEAEHYMDIGYLNTALERFEALPTDFSYDGISVSDRLDLLDEYSDFLPLCGRWRASGTQEYYAKQIWTYNGSWDRWDFTWDNPYMELSVICTIRDDGTVDINGTAEYIRCMNYSSLSALVDQETKTAYIDRNRTSPIGADWYDVNSYDDTCWVWFEDGEWWLEFYLYDSSESVNFDYQYGSDMHYGTQVEAY